MGRPTVKAKKAGEVSKLPRRLRADTYRQVNGSQISRLLDKVEKPVH